MNGRGRVIRCGAVALLALCVAAGVSAPSLAAQDVTFTPRPGNALDTRLEDFLARGDAIVWTRDTVVASDGRVAGDLLVLEAQVRLAGSVAGDIYVVDGDLFLRPGAHVAGDIVVLSGGYHGSGMATVDGEVTWRPAERFRFFRPEGDSRSTPWRTSRTSSICTVCTDSRLPLISGWTRSRCRGESRCVPPRGRGNLRLSW